MIKNGLSLAGNKVLLDKFNRHHDYLRISITERCNLRCTYCMPEEGVALSKQEKYLNLEELKRLSSIFVKLCGMRKIRLTGGEPTIDKKLLPLLEHLNSLKDHGLNTLAMTTNGLTMKKKALLYKRMGTFFLSMNIDE